MKLLTFSEISYNYIHIKLLIKQIEMAAEMNKDRNARNFEAHKANRASVVFFIRHIGSK